MAVFSVHTVWWAGRLIFIPEKDPADVHDASILLHKCCVRWWDNQAGYADQARRDEIPPTITVELPTVRRWSQASACPSPWCLQKVLLLLCAGERLITCCFGALFCLLPKKKKTLSQAYVIITAKPPQCLSLRDIFLVASVKRQWVEQDGGT